MKQTVSCSVKLKMTKASAEVLKQTCGIYRAAVAYIIDFLPPHWDAVKAISHSNAKMTYVESLIHFMAGRKAVCDFDQKFYKLPSYMRRAAIYSAIGMYSSWKPNHDSWEKAGCKGAEPVIVTVNNICPAFFRGNTFRMISDDTAMIKVFAHNDWVWIPVRMNHPNLKYIRKKSSEGWVCKAPVVEKRFGHYEMRFAMQRNNVLHETPVRNQKVCAVDLGVTTDAACCIMDSHGTILARKFINCGREKDLTEKMLRRVKEFQCKHGSHDSGIL
jgi:putative transposase